MQSKAYAPELTPGARLSFSLRANPVITTRNAAGKSVRHDVVMHEKARLLAERGLARWADWPTPDQPSVQELAQRTCGQWLQARCHRLGIALEGDTLSVEGYEQHRGKGGELRFSTADFNGILRVVDADAVRQSLFEGVGHAKAFGCGLLLIRPIG